MNSLWADPPEAKNPAEAPLDFDRDIRPLLSDNCYLCHGPAADSRQADLRLDTRAGLFSEGIVTPGDPDNSELLRRVLSHDADEMMPPPDSNLKLTAPQQQLLQRWIAQGALWQNHWSFEPPQRPELPALESSWPQNPIDHFVLEQLQQAKKSPAAPADPARLLRRVKFDLTGLPPTLEELDEFLADPSPQAYAQFVDRFLASPAFGERMAWHWLDVARYADTNGYQGDRTRTMWPWRDWVIQAFNENLPYDRFTLMQLAGDLLPDSSPTDKLATGFCRNHMINGEGGRIAEENRVEYVFDQTETMGTVWLGLTLTCARCHDHKYDPLTHQEYFQFYDFFNQTPVTGGGGDPQTAPNLRVPTASQQQQLDQLLAELNTNKQAQQQRLQELASSEGEWIAQQIAALKSTPAPWLPLVPEQAQAEHQKLTIQPDLTVLASGPNPANDTYELVVRPQPEWLPKADEPLELTALRLEALRHPSMTQNGLARSNSGNFVLTGLHVERLRSADTVEKVSIASAQASFEQGTWKINWAFDGKPHTGWAVLEGRFVDKDHAALFQFAEPIPLEPGDRLRIRLEHASPHQHHNIGLFRLSVSTQPKPTLQDETLSFRTALLTPAADRTASQQELINQQRQKHDAPLQQLATQQTKLEQQRKNLEGQVPVVMIMQDMTKPRQTFLLEKGLYSKPLGPATANVPDWLQPLARTTESRLTRLDLAEWLIAPEHPLTARVTVNRFWQLLFGHGLVRTPDDFGAQGAKPTHPELLDWLAVEFRDTGWDVKRLLKLLVTSATYQQSALVSEQNYQDDPDNRLLARGPRSRLPSWMLRDQALHVSGLLVDTVGGPSVNPYQPAGIWAEATFGKIKYTQDHGDKLYRRTLYTFWRRIVGPTMLFDNSPRQVCSVQDYRTNTPLHALVTLNDITYVEAARVLAARILRESETTPSRIEQAFRLATSRSPTPQEQAILQQRLEKLLAHYRANLEAARQLLTIGESPAPSTDDPATHAAWISLCSLILNLDESLSH